MGSFVVSTQFQILPIKGEGDTTRFWRYLRTHTEDNPTQGDPGPVIRDAFEEAGFPALLIPDMRRPGSSILIFRDNLVALREYAESQRATPAQFLFTNENLWAGTVGLPWRISNQGGQPISPGTDYFQLNNGNIIPPQTESGCLGFIGIAEFNAVKRALLTNPEQILMLGSMAAAGATHMGVDFDPDSGPRTILGIGPLTGEDGIAMMQAQSLSQVIVNANDATGIIDPRPAPIFAGLSEYHMAVQRNLRRMLLPYEEPEERVAFSMRVTGPAGHPKTAQYAEFHFVLTDEQLPTHGNRDSGAVALTETLRMMAREVGQPIRMGLLPFGWSSSSHELIPYFISPDGVQRGGDGERVPVGIPYNRSFGDLHHFSFHVDMRDADMVRQKLSEYTRGNFIEAQRSLRRDMAQAAGVTQWGR